MATELLELVDHIAVAALALLPHRREDTEATPLPVLVLLRGHLLMDPIAQTVRHKDRSAHLTQRQFALLHALSARNGRPTSAEELLTEVWGESRSKRRSRQLLRGLHLSLAAEAR